MSLVRYAKRRDLAEAGIVDALEAMGCLVYRLDVPADLLVYWRGRWVVLEVKAKKRNDQPKQDAFRALTGVPVVADAEQAMKAAWGWKS